MVQRFMRVLIVRQLPNRFGGPRDSHRCLTTRMNAMATRRLSRSARAGSPFPSVSALSATVAGSVDRLQATYPWLERDSGQSRSACQASTLSAATEPTTIAAVATKEPIAKVESPVKP